MNTLPRTAVLLAVGAGLPLQHGAALAAGSEGLTLQQMQYRESDQRMRIDYTLVSVAKDFGTDFSWAASATVDAMSGATPAVDARTGASQQAVNDGYRLGDGFASADSFDTHLIEMEDERTAVNTALTWRTPNARHEWTGSISWSSEEDYDSAGFSIEHLHNLDASRNRSLSVGISRLDNDVLFYRSGDWRDAAFNTLELGFSEVLSPTSLVKYSLFSMYEKGALSNPYKRIVRKVNLADDGHSPVYRYYLSPDARPDRRQVLGAAVRGAKQITLGEHPTALHALYRYYSDDWGVASHTIEGKAYIGRVDTGWGQWMLMARYMDQGAASFYKPEDGVFDFDDYGSNDERLASYSDNTISIGLERAVSTHWNVQLRTSYQQQSNDLDLQWTWLGINYAF